MLTSLNRLTGLPVVWRDKQVGWVERAVADVNAMRLNGLMVRRGIGSAKWVGGEGVLLVGRQCVVLSQPPVRLRQRETPEVRRAVLTTGHPAGEVCDVIIHADTLRIVALEVAQGPVYRLMGRCAYAASCRQSGADEVVVPELLSWTQLLTHLGEEEEG